MKKLVIYTAVFGDKAKLITPTFISREVDYLCFTDNPNLRSEIWNIKYQIPISENPARSAKVYKILPQQYFPEYEYSIWVDSNVVIKSELLKLLKYLDRGKTFAAFSHRESIPSIDCIYCEANYLLKLIKEGQATFNKDAIEKQIARLNKENYPEHTGLIAGMVLVRKHNDSSCIKIMENWWSEIENGSSRDELSFNYLAWKYNFPFTYIPGHCCDNEFFFNKKHVKESLLTTSTV